MPLKRLSSPSADDDVPPESVEFGAATYSVAESDDTSTTETKENEVVQGEAQRCDLRGHDTDHKGRPSVSDYHRRDVPVGDTVKSFTFTATSDDRRRHGER